MSALRTRWGQLAIGIVCMVMIANLQYGWTLFVLPISHAHGWSRAAIQVAFTVFVLCETWLLPLEGYVIDRIGPRLTVCAGGVLISASWVLDGAAASLVLLYVGAAIGGIGSGFIYGATVGNAIKWFPDRRGLAAGLTAAGFGAGSAITLVPISNMIARGRLPVDVPGLRAAARLRRGRGRAVPDSTAGFRRGPQYAAVRRRHERASPVAPARCHARLRAG